MKLKSIQNKIQTKDSNSIQSPDILIPYWHAKGWKSEDVFNWTTTTEGDIFVCVLESHNE